VLRKADLTAEGALALSVVHASFVFPAEKLVTVPARLLLGPGGLLLALLAFLLEGGYVVHLEVLRVAHGVEEVFLWFLLLLELDLLLVLGLLLLAGVSPSVKCV